MKKVDKITFENAMETPLWRVIAALEPHRKIEVTMDYLDLKLIFDLIDKEAKSQEEKDG